MKSNSEKIFCIVPAAGVGSRMQAGRPKQYLPFRSSTILDVTLARLLSSHYIEKVVVVLQAADEFWPDSTYALNENISITTGGTERADSVLNGIAAIKSQATEGDWVMVHDAARPCVALIDIDRLISAALANQSGAILATPVNDTVKEVIDGLSTRTLDRSHLWRALTPQIFKLKDLERALLNAKQKGLVVTDEASAMESLGKPVQVLEGRADNIKITSPNDLLLANFYIDEEEKQQCE
ncbi:MAG: 2-C-methyl-D-erythritol 4-phosphate cytidylyltransferase [Cycloclasticus sp.]